MCGIAGFYNVLVNQNQINGLMNKLQHRGPDDQRFYQRNDVGLIHTRLSIIDLSELGSQPYRFENFVLVFNGEIYNYKEVRQKLKMLGYSFQSNSDTEVLIKAFHCWREECVHHFIGMFAFSIYDEQNDEIFLFRDRVGVKPLYYSFINGQLFFASELKALSLFDIQKDINQEAVSLYFRFGFVPSPLSIYQAVAKLEPGHFLKINRSGLEKKCYWSVQHSSMSSKNENEWLDELESLLISAFQYRMVSDVPVGVFLSGGIDSSLLTAILQKHTGGIHSFTIGFEESAFDESIYAARIAQHLHTNHTQKILKLDEARVLLSQFYSIYDEPFADTSGIPTACVTHIAKEAGMKVVLSADGGDELFGGYMHYRNAYDLYVKFKLLPLGVRHAVSKIMRTVLPASLRKEVGIFNFEHRLYATEELLEAKNPVQFFESFIANQSTAELNQLLSSKLGSLGVSQHLNDPLQTMMTWDFEHYLPDDLLVKIDRATMYHSIECREPFLDHRLVEFSARLPMKFKICNGTSKYLLRTLLKRYVPQHYFEHKKQGFSIPIFEWFKKDLDELFNHYFAVEKLEEIPFFNSFEIQREHKKYLSYKKADKEYNMEKMWRILSFMMWWEKYNQV
jgi:asparagine synthase (glutamine-hydrolysing)